MITRWKLGNNVQHTLFASITSSDTSVTLNNASAPYKSIAIPTDKSESLRGVVTFTDSLSNPTKIEVVTFSGWVDNGDGTITLSGLLRGQEDTVASSFSPGHYAVQTMTAKSLDSPLLALDHGAGCVNANGGSDDSAPAIRARAGGIRVITADELSVNTAVEVAGSSHANNEAYFRIVAGPDAAEFHLTHPSDRTMPGNDIPSGFMTVAYSLFPTDDTQSLVMIKNASVRRLEQLRATRHAADASGSLTANVNIDWSTHDIRRMPLASDAAITMIDTSQLYPNDDKYRKLTLIVEIPDVANPGYTVTQSANVKIPNGVSAPVFNTGQNQIRVLSYLYDGTYFLYQGMQTYQL